MPTRPSNPNRTPPMAVAAAIHHHFPSGSGCTLKPSALIRRRRFRSFPHPDLLSLPPLPPFQRSRSTPCLPSSASSDDPTSIINIIGGRASPCTRSFVAEAAATIAYGARPVPAATGLSGAYFLRDLAGDCVAVVKPVVVDDDSLVLSCSSVHAGETGVREAAAYLLDHAAFAGVPPTALIRISHHAFPPANRVASIQRFVPHEFDGGEIGPSRFSVASVHRIGILDIRLLNTDRHAGNLLVQKQRVDKNPTFDVGDLPNDLVPIDHGLCLPELLEDPYFEWLHWPQATVPFSDQETEYVSKLDPFEDAELLRAELPSIREPAIRILILCTTFLKKAVDSGLCLSDIGRMMTKKFSRLEAGESVLESLCRKTEEAIEAESRHSEVEENDFGEENYAGEDKLRTPQLPSKKPLDSSQEEAGELNCDGIKVQRSKKISFKEKNEEQWMLFLERFQQLLPEAFEARKTVEVKLQSSCNS